jgi:hypothetical protein
MVRLVLGLIAGLEKGYTANRLPLYSFLSAFISDISLSIPESFF